MGGARGVTDGGAARRTRPKGSGTRPLSRITGGLYGQAIASAEQGWTGAILARGQWWLSAGETRRRYFAMGYHGCRRGCQAGLPLHGNPPKWSLRGEAERLQKSLPDCGSLSAAEQAFRDSLKAVTLGDIGAQFAAHSPQEHLLHIFQWLSSEAEPLSQADG